MAEDSAVITARMAAALAEYDEARQEAGAQPAAVASLPLQSGVTARLHREGNSLDIEFTHPSVALNVNAAFYEAAETALYQRIDVPIRDGVHVRAVDDFARSIPGTPPGTRAGYALVPTENGQPSRVTVVDIPRFPDDFDAEAYARRAEAYFRMHDVLAFAEHDVDTQAPHRFVLPDRPEQVAATIAQNHDTAIGRAYMAVDMAFQTLNANSPEPLELPLPAHVQGRFTAARLSPTDQGLAITFLDGAGQPHDSYAYTGADKFDLFYGVLESLEGRLREQQVDVNAVPFARVPFHFLEMNDGTVVAKPTGNAAVAYTYTPPQGTEPLTVEQLTALPADAWHIETNRNVITNLGGHFVARVVGGGDLPDFHAGPALKHTLAHLEGIRAADDAYRAAADRTWEDNDIALPLEGIAIAGRTVTQARPRYTDPHIHGVQLMFEHGGSVELGMVTPPALQERIARQINAGMPEAIAALTQGPEQAHNATVEGDTSPPEPRAPGEPEAPTLTTVLDSAHRHRIGIGIHRRQQLEAERGQRLVTAGEEYYVPLEKPVEHDGVT